MVENRYPRRCIPALVYTCLGQFYQEDISYKCDFLRQKNDRVALKYSHFLRVVDVGILQKITSFKSRKTPKFSSDILSPFLHYKYKI